MIKAGKLAVIVLGRFVVGVRSLRASFESTQESLPSMGMDRSLPFSVAKDNTLESRFIVFPNATILEILSLGALSQIFSSIIKRVLVYVVSHFFFFEAQDRGVHSNPSVSSYVSTGVILVSRLTNGPTPLHQPVVIRSIDNGIFPFSEWNQAVRWVERLSNGMPWKWLSGHVLTSNENLVFSRYFSMDRGTICLLQ